MKDFEWLLGTWHGDGMLPTQPPIRISVDASVERLGEFIVFRSSGEPADLPDSLSIIGGAPDGEPQPMQYFDERGVQRRYLTTREDRTWRIWLAPEYDWRGPAGPGFDQRFVGQLSTDGDTIDGRWERGLGADGDRWEVDFPLTYTRTGPERGGPR